MRSKLGETDDPTGISPGPGLDTLSRLEVFWQRLSSFSPKSRFPNHPAEATGRDCIDSAELSPWHTPLGIGGHGIETSDFLHSFRSLQQTPSPPIPFIDHFPPPSEKILIFALEMLTTNL